MFPFNIAIYYDVHRHSTMKSLGMPCGAEVLPMVALCFLLAALLHADMNSGSLNSGQKLGVELQTSMYSIYYGLIWVTRCFFFIWLIMGCVYGIILGY